MDYTPIQLVIPLELTKIIDISDPVYSFNEVMNHMDLNKYFTVRTCKLGRPAYDRRTLLRLVLFAFMEEGYNSLRHIEKLCRNDIRFLYLLGNMPAPSHQSVHFPERRCRSAACLSGWHESARQCTSIQLGLEKDLYSNDRKDVRKADEHDPGDQ